MRVPYVATIDLLSFGLLAGRGWSGWSWNRGYPGKQL